MKTITITHFRAARLEQKLDFQVLLLSDSDGLALKGVFFSYNNRIYILYSDTWDSDYQPQVAGYEFLNFL